MVKVPPPPPSHPPTPTHLTLPAGHRLVRIFNPSAHGVTALGFRRFGPLERFDHHRPAPDGAGRDDPSRGVYYAADRLSCCLVEVFGDTWVVEEGDRCVAQPALLRDLVLLDLRGPAAMRAGIAAAVAKVIDRDLTQAWARFFHERADLYGHVDGLAFHGAYNDEVAYVLFERADDALDCPPAWLSRLDDPRWVDAITEAVIENGLIWFGPAAR